MNKDIAKKLKQARVSNNMTQQEMGEAMGVGRSYISQWEAGSRNINAEQLIKFAEVTGIDLNCFGNAQSEHSRYFLLVQLSDYFASKEIPEQEKDRAFRDMMEIYLKHKKEE